MDIHHFFPYKAVSFTAIKCTFVQFLYCFAVKLQITVTIYSVTGKYYNLQVSFENYKIRLLEITRRALVDNWVLRHWAE
jgi:hypothetical protein